MSLQFCSLNSGSNGNCYYIGNDVDAVLVDAGLTLKDMHVRMQLTGLSMDRVRAIFISHEHSDHIKGLCALASRYKLPVYITKHTHLACGFTLPPEQVHVFTDGVAVQVGSLEIMPFRKFHDAADPHSFTISSNGARVGVFTDIGRPCGRLRTQLALCHGVFLESNYDEEMLEQGSYPWFLKNRIRGGQGHLSNREALELFLAYRSPGLSHVLLAHLSRNNNCPDKALALFAPHAGNVTIAVASRFEPSPVYTVYPNQAVPLPVSRMRRKALVSTAQLSLFGEPDTPSRN